jgi:hypothetical protein
MLQLVQGLIGKQSIRINRKSKTKNARSAFYSGSLETNLIRKRPHQCKPTVPSTEAGCSGPRCRRLALMAAVENGRHAAASSLAQRRHPTPPSAPATRWRGRG